ncbi:MAG: LytR family transcriptional regulator [Actinomyces sp.]|nr:MAG: LytR family transcriptional regulator [Actinomyces sp.]
MVGTGEVILRRTWPQRLVILLCLAVIGGSLAGAWFVQTLYEGLRDVPRVAFAAEVLSVDPKPGEPVNFLLVGTDSTRGLAPDDPILIARDIDPEGRSLADVIMVLRVDPTAGRAWVLSIPRDLYVDIPGAQPNKINAALFLGGPEKLVETVSGVLDIEINNYVQVDFLGFRNLVDVLGGVPVWFEHPARDLGSGLDIATAGCHVLGPEQALAYVRGRTYQEWIDGRWVITGGDDFRRIERQQDFLVLALDRAIERGARNVTTMSRLLEAATDAVLLDTRLTLAELLELGQAFADFDPENLQRYSLPVWTDYRDDGSYLGERLLVDEAQPILDVFRGAADLVRPADVPVVIVGDDPAARDDAALVLGGSSGFPIADVRSVPDGPSETTVVHPPGALDAALLVARYLDPVPHVVESSGVDEVTVVLGDDYRGVLFLFPTPIADLQAAIVAAGPVPDLPDLATAVSVTTTSSTTSVAPATTSLAPTTTAPEAAADTDPPADGTGVAASPTTSVTTTTAGIIGRPPEGVSCG